MSNDCFWTVFYVFVLGFFGGGLLGWSAGRILRKLR